MGASSSGRSIPIPSYVQCGGLSLFLQLCVLQRMRSLQYYLLYFDTKCTAPQVNIFMGIGLLSMPFAMRQSGWMGMFALAIATAVFCVSGKLIVCNFEKMPPDVAHTYPALGAPPNSECISSSYAKQKGVCALGSTVRCISMWLAVQWQSLQH